MKQMVPKSDAALPAPSALPDLQQTAQEQATLTQRVLADLQARPVTTAEGFELAGEELKEIKGEFKRIDEIRKSATAPLQQVIDTINGWFKKPLDYLRAAEALRKNEMTEFLRKQREEQQRAMEEASAASLAGDTSAAAVALMRVEPTVPKVAGIRKTTSYRFEVTDFAELVKSAVSFEVGPDGKITKVVDQIRLGLLQPNDAAIGALARSSKGTCEIPGVKVWAEDGIASTSSRGAK